MKIFLYTYHAVPTEKVEDYETCAGAYVNCYVEADNVCQGLTKAEQEIKNAYWTDLEFQDAMVAEPDNLDSNKIEYYEQALIDKEVLVFHRYPIDDEENEKSLTGFSLWLEFEEVDPGNWDTENEFCNIHVDLPDGRHYGISVWTYKFLENAVGQYQESGENLNGKYLKPPDLFVSELTRDCIEKAIHDLLKQGDLEQVLNPSIME